MKGFTRVVLGSVASAFLGAASFFAIDGLMPNAADAQTADLGVNIVSSSLYAEKSIYLASSSLYADKSVYVGGKCSSRGSTDIYLASSSLYADESWYPASSSLYADMTICLTGDVQEWFEKAE